MSADIERVQQLVEEALRLPDEERSQFIHRACSGNTALHDEVESLLQHADVPEGDFLRPPERQIGKGENSADALIGTQLGAYRICGVIAAGGMGTVFEAEQRQPQRKVAVKIMRAWTPSSSARHRFEFEAKTLARLTHPNIARIYEAGTHGDLPYFVMEYIPDALAITEFANQNSLDTTDRLKLILTVCEAIQHGHQKGVIHRDLKPSNILVDEEGHIKIIDFGVARSTDPDGTMTMSQTGVGHLIGTLQFMSPEQFETDPGGLDIRTDVYSIGVVLYHLLCGRLPYDVSTVNIAKAARVICEEPVTRPSSIHRHLRGDLERVILKSLHKDREQRYQSGSDLARDIRHVLNHEPVEARPATPWSGLIRWISLHPLASTSVAVAALTAALTLGTTLASIRIARGFPADIMRNEARTQVRLLAMSGEELYSWGPTDRPSFGDATLVQCPKEFGDAKLAVIAFGQAAQQRHARSLCAFDISARAYQEPLWQRRMVTDVMPDFSNERSGFDANDFHPTGINVTDVFPEHPGDEIIVMFAHTFSRRAIQIYGLEGKLLYQIWHDGCGTNADSVYWMKQSELLVLSGNDASAYWPDRGFPKEQRYPYVIFAVRPRLGKIHKTVLTAETAESVLDLVWYSGLLPSDASGTFELLSLGVPEIARLRDGMHAALYARYEETDILACWHIDSWGRMVPEANVANDAYNQDITLPRLERFHLGSLPPLRSNAQLPE